MKRTILRQVPSWNAALNQPVHINRALSSDASPPRLRLARPPARRSPPQPVPRVRSNRLLPPNALFSDHLQAHLGDNMIAKTPWVCIRQASPIISLDDLCRTIRRGLDQESLKKGGILDLDAPWEPTNNDKIPFTEFNNQIVAAQVSLSLFARPAEWYVQLQNRSMAQALVTHAREESLCFGHGASTIEPVEGPTDVVYDVSDSVLRVENCAPETTAFKIMNVFSRYELDPHREEAVVEWKPRRTVKGVKIPKVFFVYFEDATWARAALREKQLYQIRDKNMRYTPEIVLAQFPRQIIVQEEARGDPDDRDVSSVEV